MTGTATEHSQTIAKYKEYVATSFVASVEPVVVDHADGSRVWDADGTEYIDCFAGIAVTNSGHRNPKVIEAAKAQMDKLVHAATYIYHVPVVADCAEKLAQISPGKLSKTFFGNSGAEGIETALRMAKAYTGKREIISLTHSFHGRTNATLAITGNMQRKTNGGPYMSGVAFAPAPYVYRNPFNTNDPEVVAEKCAEMVEWAINYQSSGDVAAFITEGLWGEGGIIVPPGATAPVPVQEQLQWGNPHGAGHVAGFGNPPTQFALDAARYQAARAVKVATRLTSTTPSSAA